MSFPAPFGRYELLERIGRGGMADIFLARAFGAAGFEKKLVIKRIRSEHAKDPRFVTMFIHEARIGVHLNHPNLVAVYELGKVGEAWYIAMEWVHGPDVNRILRALRAQETRMPVGIAVRILAEALRGLGYAHGLPDVGEDGVGLVHRDVSPHNLLVTFTGDVKLVDFGIARLLSEGTWGGPATARADDEGAIPGGGKFQYMSPEQARGETIDARSDLYSAGMVLWEMLVGDKMHRGLSPDDKLRHVREATFVDPAERGLALDPFLLQVLRRAMAPNPADRYDSALAFEEDLRGWLYQQPDQPGRAQLGSWIQALFPDDRADARAGDELRRLVDDLKHLDRTGSTQTGSDLRTPGPDRASGPPIDPADERKRVAALVIDVDGFTAISERAEPDVVFQRHLAMLRWMRGVLDKHGGTLQHMHDDQAYVMFGLERTRRDDLDRALACATELQRRVGEMARQGLPIALAIGVHTGDVTVGHAGARVRYNARGNTTRLARRLSEQCDHGQILASDEVQRAMEATWSFQRGPWLLGRGGRAPDPTWAVGPRRRVPAATGPWLRRADELSDLQDALRAVAEGSGVTVAIAGESGTGKSRLVGELTVLAERRGLPVLTARATPFGHPLAVARELLLGVLGLEPDADDAAVRKAVAKLLPMGIGARDREAADALLGLRRLRVDPADAWMAVREVLSALSDTGPVVVVVEDVQHLTPAILAGLVRSARGLRERPILLITTTQPPLPDALADARTIALEAFTPALQARLAAERLGAERLEPTLEARVHATCEGNPLTIEEFARFLRDQDHIRVVDGVAHLRAEAAAELPATLASLGAARIDSLDPAAKGALQIAAVIGSTFAVDVLADVVGIDDPTPIVDDLAAHGLVRRTPARGVWSFSSDFIRECALRASLSVQRRDHHRLVASALERRLGDDPDPATLARLARHCGEGGRPLDAARYAYAAGRDAETSHQLPTAHALYRDGLRWIQQVEETQETYEPRTQGEAMLRLRLGRIQLRQGEVRKGLGALRIALDAAEDAGLPWVSARAHLALGWHHVDAGQSNQAHAHLTAAWRLAQGEDDVDLELEVTEARAALALSDGVPADATAIWELMVERLPREAPAQHARTLAGLARVAVHAGDARAAARHLEAALVDTRRAADRRQEARVLEQLGRVALWDGRHDEALRRFRSALAVREDLGHGRGIARGLRHLGDVHLLAGDLTRAHVHFRRSRDVAREAGWRHGVVLADAYLGYIDGKRGQDGGEQALADAIEAARNLDDHESALTASWLLARLEAAQGARDTAMTRLDAAEREARRRHLDPVATLLRTTRDAVRAGSDDPSVAPTP